MEEQDYEFSIASALAYDYYYSNMDVDKTQEGLSHYMPGYKLDEELSTLNHIVIQRPDESAIVAYRGTDPTNPYDLFADAIILGGAHRDAVDLRDTRFNLAEQYYIDAKVKYGAVDLTGQSLGGTMGDLIGTKYGEKSVIFNPGASPMEFLNKNYPVSTSKVYKTDTLDLISMSSRGYANPIEVPQSERGALPFLNIKSHDIKNFLPTYDMLPLNFDGDPDVIIPSRTPVAATKEEVKEVIKEESIEQQILCDLQPELAPSFCKPQLRFKKTRQ
tara:strand:- start:2183 stop:3004 length:822 start_codon:yes stop_codon:yes gene_type:complete